MDDTFLAKVEATVDALRGATEQATQELDDARSERAALDTRIEQIESLLVELDHATEQAERTLRTGRDTPPQEQAPEPAPEPEQAPDTDPTS
jgi:chromosome segregation ATPase